MAQCHPCSMLLGCLQGATGGVAQLSLHCGRRQSQQLSHATIHVAALCRAGGAWAVGPTTIGSSEATLQRLDPS